MSLRLSPVVLALATLSLVACSQPEPTRADVDAESAAAASERASELAGPSAAFDLSAVPVSTAPLAASPYFTVPAGYRTDATGTIQATEFPVWTGAGFQIVEGDVHWTRIGEEDGKTLSRLEVARAIEAQVLAAGGVKVASGQIPESAVAALPEMMRTELLDALGDNTNSPTTSYVIRRADKTIWVNSVVSIEVAYLSVIESAPFVAPAT